jgi:hypothetical protein
MFLVFDNLFALCDIVINMSSIQECYGPYYTILEEWDMSGMLGQTVIVDSKKIKLLIRYLSMWPSRKTLFNSTE